MDGFKNSGIRRLALEVTSEESVQQAIDSVIVAEGKIDVLVNNAGGVCIGMHFFVGSMISLTIPRYV